MRNATDGNFQVVIEGETHLNRTVITSDMLFFTFEGGYSYCHPYKVVGDITENQVREYLQFEIGAINTLEKNPIDDGDAQIKHISLW